MSAGRLIVIGGGISGIFSACLAAKKGYDTTILSYGQGALAVAGGIIDIFGYDDRGVLVTNPYEHIKKLPKTHPYSKIGADNVALAVDAFKALCAESGFEYYGDIRKNQFVPTAIGSFKPSCLTPRTIDCDALERAERICVVGFELLKDFYPEMIVENLRKYYEGKKEVTSCKVFLPLKSGIQYRDVTALDIARLLETEEGLLNVKEQLRKHAGHGCVFLLPPVLGEMPNYTVLDSLTSELRTGFVEVSAIPPSVTGFRTDNMLIATAKRLGVDFIEKARVVDSIVEGGRCRAVITQGFDRRREYPADHFILATGGVFGGGLKATMGAMEEPIFHIKIDVPHDQQEWSYQYLFTGKPQMFATYGVEVNDSLNPVDASGRVIAENVSVVGRCLGGYDFCFEKSGNGVAIASAFHAVSRL